MNSKLSTALIAAMLLAGGHALAQTPPAAPPPSPPSGSEAQAPEKDASPPAPNTPDPQPDTPPPSQDTAPPVAPDPSPPPPTTPAPPPADSSGAVPGGPSAGTLTPMAPIAAPEQTPPLPGLGPQTSDWVMNAGFGYASGALRHPDINESTFSGPGMEISVGTELDPKLRLSVAFSAYEMKLELGPGQKYIQKSYAAHGGSGLQTLAEIPGGPVTGAGQGGVLWRTPFHLSTLGPRLDYLPFGDHGPYVGVTLGMGMIPEIKPLFGAAGAARIGGEYRFLKSVGIGAEAGAYGHLYDGVRAALPYVQIRMTLMLDPATLKGGPSSPMPGFKPLR